MKKGICIASVLVLTGLMLAGRVLPSRVMAQEKTEEILIDFDKPKEAMRFFRLRGFDRGAFSQDSEYVMQGSGCLRICPNNTEFTDCMLMLYPDKKDFRDADYVSIDVYNPTSNEIQAILGCARNQSRQPVKPGRNTVWLYIDRTRLEYNSSGEAKDFYLQFDKGNLEDGRLDVYVDNFKCYYTDIPYETFRQDLKQDTKLGFESTAELEDMSLVWYLRSNFKKPVFSINRDVRYIQNGTGSLKVEFAPQGEAAFSTVTLGDFNLYSEELDKRYLAFPIYNGNDFEIACTVLVTSNYNGEQVSVTTVIPAGSWSDPAFIIPLDVLDRRFTGTGLDVGSIEFQFDGVYDGGTVYLDSIGVYKK